MTSLTVLIVNDSATMCASLRLALQQARGIEVVGEIRDGCKAVEAVVALRPQVVLMDVVMPGCDGYQATRAIMERAPTPVVMVTAAANPRDERVILEALGAGALSVIQAPPAPSSPEYKLAVGTLAQLLIAMAGAHPRPSAPPPSPKPRTPLPAVTGQVQAIGVVASAGGPPALVTIFRELAAHTMPPILLVQHMSRGFAPGFSDWLRDATGYPVVVAESGVTLVPGTIYVPPDDRHLGVERGGRALVTSEPPTGVFRPSGDYLLTSLARVFGDRAAGVVLSGMGSDGAAGATVLAGVGGVVVVQDAATAAVDGMPRAVRERVASARVVALDAIASLLLTLTGRP